MDCPAGVKVLFAANCSVFQEQLKDQLQRFRCEVTVIDNTQKALELVTKHKEIFDLLIVNIESPLIEKFEHLELPRIVKTLPVILLSQSHNENITMKAYVKGGSTCLFKPIQIDDLKNIWSCVMKSNHTDIDQENNNISIDPKDYNYEGPINEVSSRKNDRKRDGLDESKNNEQNNDKEDASLVPQKKPRLIWTDELKSKFRNAVNNLGVDKAKPKQILEIMKVPYLTRDHVASHLQKYKAYLRKVNAIKIEQNARTTTSQGGITTNISGDHLVHSRPNEACVQQVPHDGFNYDWSSVNASSFTFTWNSTMLEETNFSASFGDQVFPSQVDLTGAMESRNDMTMSVDSGLDLDLLQITRCNEVPSIALPTLPFMAKSGPELLLEPQLQYKDVPIKVKSFQQVTQSTSDHVHEHSTHNSLLEPRLQNDNATTNATPLSKGPSQQEDCFKQLMPRTLKPQSQYQHASIDSSPSISQQEGQLKQVMQSALGHFKEKINSETLKPQLQCQPSTVNLHPFIEVPSQQEDELNKVMASALGHENSLNNGSLEPQLQCQDSMIDAAPLTLVPSQPKGCHELCTPNILDAHNRSTKNRIEPNDSSLDGSFHFPTSEGLGGEDEFAHATLKVMREMGLTVEAEQILIQSDFDCYWH